MADILVKGLQRKQPRKILDKTKDMRVLLLSSHTPSLFWFRVDMMKEMKAEGYEVYASGQMPETEWAERFEEIGVTYRQIKVSRNGLNPIGDLATLKDIKRLLKEIRPDKIFVFQAKTVAYGCMAAASLGITEVYTLIAGLGSVYLGHGLKNRVVKFVMSALYKQAFRKSKQVFFQNNDDKQTMLDEGLLKEDKIVMIHGSGVNVEKFTPAELPDVPTFLYIGRLIRDKGVGEYLEACKIIKAEYGDKVRCLLVGPYDSNPSALKPEELQPLVDSGIIEYFGEQRDVRPYISQCSIYVLPSYHEGTPKTVLESMAMGRAIITTDAPGCKETVVDGVNGYLTRVKDAEDVALKMKTLIEHPETVAIMGRKSREMACELFDVKKVNDTILRTMGMRS